MPQNDERVSFDSPFYPYKRIIDGNVFDGAELIPYKILMYLLDLPDAYGYMPVDDNSRPRVRLIKLLTYDCANPLAEPLPTPEQKLSLLFNGEQPDINTDEQKNQHPFGYRLFMQHSIQQSGLEAKTVLKIYPGRILDPTDFRAIIGLQAEIWVNPNLANVKTTARDRLFDIECALRDALNCVDISGVGLIHFSRNDGSFNGSENLYTNHGDCGRIIYFSTAWMGGGSEPINTFSRF